MVGWYECDLEGGRWGNSECVAVRKGDMRALWGAVVGRWGGDVGLWVRDVLIHHPFSRTISVDFVHYRWMASTII